MDCVTLLITAVIYVFFSGEPHTGSDTLFSNSTDIRDFEKWIHRRGIRLLFLDYQRTSRQSRLLTFLEWIEVRIVYNCKVGLVAVEEIKPNSTLIELDLDDVMYFLFLDLSSADIR